MFVASKPKGDAESFEAAVKRLKLSEVDIQAKQKQFLMVSYCYIIVTSLVFFYFLYLLLSGSFRGALAAFGITCLGLAFSFSKHFWYIQMKHRRLGLSFRQWRQLAFQRSSKK